ncbi:hypothetical protein CLOM_g6557, partial [Closterium sp. NIES-68]
LHCEAESEQCNNKRDKGADTDSTGRVQTLSVNLSSDRSASRTRNVQGRVGGLKPERDKLRTRGTETLTPHTTSRQVDTGQGAREPRRTFNVTRIPRILRGIL